MVEGFNDIPRADVGIRPYVITRTSNARPYGIVQKKHTKREPVWTLFLLCILLEEYVDAECCERDSENCSFEEADDDFLEGNWGLSSEHNCSCFGEEDNLTHGNETYKCASFISKCCNLALDNENREEHFSDTDWHTCCDCACIRNLENLEKWLEDIAEPCEDRCIFSDDHSRNADSGEHCENLRNNESCVLEGVCNVLADAACDTCTLDSTFKAESNCLGCILCVLKVFCRLFTAVIILVSLLIDRWNTDHNECHDKYHYEGETIDLCKLVAAACCFDNELSKADGNSGEACHDSNHFLICVSILLPEAVCDHNAEGGGAYERGNCVESCLAFSAKLYGTILLSTGLRLSFRAISALSVSRKR